MAKPARDQLWVVRMGTVPYREALAFQEQVRELRQDGALPDVLLLLEHPPTYTQGRRSRRDELSMAPEWYEQQGIDIVTVPRGGLLTYHGPGQLVGYPIVRMKDVSTYVHTLENALVAALADVGIAAHARPEDGPAYMGVWVEQERKLASVGVHIAHHVATHGFAVNVDNDMRPWEWAVACGLPGVQMTSIADELGETTLTRPPADTPLEQQRPPSERLERLSAAVVVRLAQALGRRAVEMPVAALGVAAPEAEAEPEVGAGGPISSARP